MRRLFAIDVFFSALNASAQTAVAFAPRKEPPRFDSRRKLKMRHIAATALLFAAFLTSAIAQTGAPQNTEVQQLAYEVVEKVVGAGVPVDPSDPRLIGEGYFRYNVDARNGAQLKSKHTVGDAILPKWSPDGGRLAFLTSCSRGVHCVEVADQDGSHRIRVTRETTKIPGESMTTVSLAWSPTGDEIAYIEEGRKAWTTISTIRSDGSARKEVLRLQCLVFDPRLDWSPDGKKLAVSGCSDLVAGLALGNPPMALGKATVVVIDLVTGDTHVLAVGSDPRWSPDGMKLLFRKAGLWVVNSDGTQERKVLDGPLAGLGLSWLHSGQGLVFGGAQDINGASEIFRINVDGTGLKKLASGAQQGLSFVNPILSSDDQQLIVSADTCFPCSLHDAGSQPPQLSSMYAFSALIMDKSAPSVLLIDLASGHEDRLADGSHPSVVWAHK